MAETLPPAGFLRRWARLKSGAAEAQVAPPPVAAEPGPAAPPTLADVAQLGADADFSRFVAPGVDGTVRRLALKKLFADPHFNVPDGLDIYMDDYTRADPIPAAMMAALHHARNVFGAAAGEQDPADPAAPDPAATDKTDPAEPAGADPGAQGAPVATPPDPAVNPDPDDITV
ncbi:DUF3306 domain-containing protein [Pseudoduganella armeniaca]|uniref:DUF3306 domain-containing protein n=1 Tax=Pseudoduganella armeniaca TaxID=2072590 RepID=A0A2R4C9J6_9BURK|nr:DUF3306 domain-containing protein [Pseudoduganella armeniaca]AVR96263.1 DUF3306 domain-containing protein [Pseudoduganella armeniaca]